MDKLNQIYDMILNYISQELNLELVLSSFLQVLTIIILTWLVMNWRVKAITKIFKLTKMDGKKQQTLSSLLLSLTKYVIIVISGLLILYRLNVDITPILASAGIVGLALGLGAQNLIKDTIAGFFIMFEDWMHVGDYVKIGQIAGTVEEIGLRSTTIREWSGTQVHLLNSSITQLTNYNREKMRPIISFNIPYEYPTEKVAKIVELACDRINNEYKDNLLTDFTGNIVEPIQLYGITDVENNALGAKYTIIGLVKDESYWLMSKEIRRIVLGSLLENNIQISYPKRIYTNEPNVEEIKKNI